ncbi:MAG TPA: hypothetical protein VM100_10250 [Longimicrobiales bacterium]|nr:hypothetical protein [Longimicrobiales bacterium]
MLARTVGCIGIMAAGAAGVQPDTRERISCQEVKGSLNATATAMGLSAKGLKIHGTGLSAGDLEGKASLEVLKPFSGGAIEVSFDIASPRGTIVISGKTSATAVNGVPNARRIRGDLLVEKGSGVFVQSHGAVQADGRANTRTKTIEITYAGEVCAAWGAL